MRVIRVNPAAEVVRGKNVYQAELEMVGPLAAGRGRVAAAGDDRDHQAQRRALSPMLVTLLRPLVYEVRMRMWW